MKLQTITAAALALALAGCGTPATDEEEAPAGPAPLELTPGSWALNGEQVNYADEDRNVLATMRCDGETGELLLETPGAFAEGARAAMVVRVGEIMHGIEGVQVEGEGEDAVKIARIPVQGALTRLLLAGPAPMTIETAGSPPVMIETDEVLQNFVTGCQSLSGAVPPSEAAPPSETALEADEGQ